MQEISYQYPRFERLQPRSEWRGGRLADTDLLTLEEAAGFASKHAGEEITARDFLRAAGRGEITLRAIVHRAAKVRKHDGGVLFNKGEPNENIVPAGAIPTLPLSACQHLANAGRASWRTFDGFEERNGMLMRYTKGMLADDEPDFETVSADCRVVGYDVHALADEYTAPETKQAEPQAAPMVAANAEQRQARRWQMCIDAGLPMPQDTYAQLPRGIKEIAKAENITRQALAQDLNAHRERLFGK